MRRRTALKTGPRRLRRGTAAVAVCCICLAALAAAVLLPSAAPKPEIASLARFVERYGGDLLRAAQERPGESRRVRFRGIELGIDGRTEGAYTFYFPWSLDPPEGEMMLVQTDGALHYLDHVFSGTGRIDGIALLGRGWIECTLLAPGWYFVSCYLPT